MLLGRKTRTIVGLIAVLAVSYVGLAEIWNQARCRMIVLRLRLDEKKVAEIKAEIALTEQARQAGTPYVKPDRVEYLQDRMLDFGTDYPNSWAEESQGLQRILAGYRNFVTQESTELAEVKRHLLLP